MRLRNLLCALSLIPAIAVAQGNVVLEFSSAGNREIWISDKIALPPASLKTEEAKLTLPRQGGPKDRLYVWDRKTGNVASRAVTDIKGVWKLESKDYQLIGRTVVRVEHGGKPVEVAFVKLKDATGERESQIDGTKKGEAVFFGIKPGPVKVTVRYTVNGKDAEPAVQNLVFELERPSPDPVVSVSISEPVATLGGSESEPATDSRTSPSSADAATTAPRGSMVGNALVYLLGLAAAIAAIFFGLKYAKQNQDKVKAQLEKVGVQIPEPQEDPPAPAQAPATSAPPQKIILDGADPSVPPLPMPTAMNLEGPSLLMANGDAFPIAEGETTVGREAGNTLTLVAESTVSRRHATLTRSGNLVTLRDDGSSNGTFVNGVKLASEAELKPGDQIQFGEAKFRFEA